MEGAIETGLENCYGSNQELPVASRGNSPLRESLKDLSDPIWRDNLACLLAIEVYTWHSQSLST